MPDIETNPPAPSADEQQAGLLSPKNILAAVVPFSLYFLLTKAFRIGQTPALVCGLLVGAAFSSGQAILRRKVGQLELFTLLLLGLALLAGVVSNEPRVVLVVQAADGSLVALYFLVTLWLGAPFLNTFLKPLFTKGNAAKVSAWDQHWRSDLAFRRRIALLTYVCAGGFVIGSLIGMTTALTLPLDLAVALSPFIAIPLAAATLLTMRALSKPLQTKLRASAEPADQTN